MNPTSPSTRDLKRLLNLLVLLNKYDVQEYEEYLVTLITPLTSQASLKTHLKEDLSASDVLRIAKKVHQPSIVESARNVILDQLWNKEILASPYETLLFGEDLGDNAIIGASYYQILLHGQDAWLTTTLTDTHRRNLLAGMIRCGKEWQTIFDALAGVGSHPFVRQEHWIDYYGNQRLVELWRSLGQSRLPWFDLMGKIKTTVAHSPYECVSEVEKIKNDLYLYFTPEPCDVNEPETISSPLPQDVS